MVFLSCFRHVFECHLQIGHSRFLKHPFYLILTILPYGTDMCINPQTKHCKKKNCLLPMCCKLWQNIALVDMWENYGYCICLICRKPWRKLSHVHLTRDWKVRLPSSQWPPEFWLVTSFALAIWGLALEF
jgi:hypothetical protein